jgi:hypothetical protein
MAAGKHHIAALQRWLFHCSKLALSRLLLTKMHMSVNMLMLQLPLHCHCSLHQDATLLHDCALFAAVICYSATQDTAEGAMGTTNNSCSCCSHLIISARACFKVTILLLFKLLQVHSVKNSIVKHMPTLGLISR